MKQWKLFAKAVRIKCTSGADQQNDKQQPLIMATERHEQRSKENTLLCAVGPVSYTHLTLPTIYSV